MGRAPHSEQPSLFKIQSQSETCQPLLQHLIHFSCIVLVFKADHKIVRVTDHLSAALYPWFDLLVKPLIEYVV